MDNKLSELKASAMAATPGPWFVHEKPCEDGNYGIDTSDNEWTAEAVVWWGFARQSIWKEEDARFIAAANPAVVLALLAELEAKDKRIAELEQEPTIKHMRSVEEALIRATDMVSELEAKLANREAQPAGFYTTVSGRKGVVWHNGAPEDDTAIFTTPPAPAVQSVVDWRLDESTGAKILMYKDCSVIEDQQAEYVLSLIRPATAAPDAVDIFADQVIGTKTKIIHMPAPLNVPQEGIRIYLNADELFMQLENQGCIVLIEKH